MLLVYGTLLDVGSQTRTTESTTESCEADIRGCAVAANFPSMKHLCVSSGWCRRIKRILSSVWSFIRHDRSLASGSPGKMSMLALGPHSSKDPLPS